MFGPTNSDAQNDTKRQMIEKRQKDGDCVPVDVKHLDFDDKLHLFARIVIPSALYLSSNLERDDVFQQ